MRRGSSINNREVDETRESQQMIFPSMVETERTTTLIFRKKPLRVDGSLFWLSAIIFVTNCLNGQVAPFLPLELDKIGMDATMFGIIISTYYVAIMLCSPLNKLLMKRISKRSLL